MKSASSLRLFALSALTSLCTDAAHCQDVSKEDVDDMYGKSEAAAPEVKNDDISVIRPGARFHVTLDDTDGRVQSLRRESEGDFGVVVKPPTLQDKTPETGR